MIDQRYLIESRFCFMKYLEIKNLLNKPGGYGSVPLVPLNSSFSTSVVIGGGCGRDMGELDHFKYKDVLIMLYSWLFLCCRAMIF